MIKIDKQYISNSNYTPLQFGVYTALRALYNGNYADAQIIDTDMLLYSLQGNFDDKYKRQIVKALNDLIDKNEIKLIEKHGYKYLLDISNYNITKDNFYISFDKSEIQKIFLLDKAMELLRYFCVVIANTSNKCDEICNIYGYTSINTLASTAHISIKTAIKYNKILEDAQLIFVYRQGLNYIDGNGNIKTVNNCYGRYCNKDLIIKAGKEYKQGLVNQGFNLFKANNTTEDTTVNATEDTTADTATEDTTANTATEDTTANATEAKIKNKDNQRLTNKVLELVKEILNTDDNTIPNKLINEWLKIQPIDNIYDYLKYDEWEIVNILLEKDFRDLNNKSRYFNAIVKNSLETYIEPKEYPIIPTDPPLFEHEDKRPYKQNKRRGLAYIDYDD